TRNVPGTPSSEIGFSQITKTGIHLSLTKGSGDKRIIIARAGSAVDAEPVDGTAYTAGQDLGDGNFVVYSGAGESVSITGLSSNTATHVAVFEFNEFGGATTDEFYQTTAPATASQATSAIASMAASNVVFSNPTSNSMTISFDAGDGAQRLVLVK